MEQLQIICDKDSPQNINQEILLKAIYSGKDKIEYKFIIGSGGVWSTVQDFSEESIFRWNPKKEGEYTIMIQGKKADSRKSFHCIAKKDYAICEVNRIIQDVIVEKDNLIVGEKLIVEVISSSKDPILFRFLYKGKEDWKIIRDYSIDNKLIYTVNKEGKQEILVECKKLNSKDNLDEFTTVIFESSLPKKIEITDFKCLNSKLLVDEELVFKVKDNIGDKRALLYKFIKVNKEGRAICIQDYSSRNIVTFKEREAGEYKLLCLVRDLLSVDEYDDRALISYTVKQYNDIKITRFITDMSSPQINGTLIKFKSNVVGGIDIVYRYIIEGPMFEDSGYIREDNYEWIPRREGEYIITLEAKDISFDGEFEDKKVIRFSIDRKADKAIKILDIIVDNENKVLVGNPVSIKVISEGGLSLKYSFIIYFNGKVKEKINFGENNWINFIPDEKGEYEIEIKVKDKYTIKEYDSHTFVYLKVREYFPGEIDYILLPHKNNYLVDDIIDIETIVQNTKDVLLKYVTEINGCVVEDTGFIETKKIQIKPQCAGKYKVNIYAKNVKCEGEYDTKKSIIIHVLERTPVINTNIKIDKEVINVNKEVTFIVESNGGKEVCYEFYIMENNNWIKVQGYSRKNKYTFIPFLKGNYRVMVLAKSFYKKVSYEDYCESSFKVV